MLKSYSIYFIISLAIYSFFATAHNDPLELCYPLEHGENGFGSSNFKYLSQLIIGVDWYLDVYITNVGVETVNVKVFMNKSDGTEYIPSTIENYDQFNDENSPNNYLSGGGLFYDPGIRVP